MLNACRYLAKARPIYTIQISSPYLYNKHLVMLNRLLRQKRLMMPLIARPERRPDQVIEEEGTIYQKDESENLQPLERLPAEA